MRANPFYYGHIVWRASAPTMRPVLAGIPVMLVLGGCATSPPVGVTCGNVQPLSESLRLQLGTVALGPACPPAQVSFEPPAGQVGTFGEAAGASAGNLLAPTAFGSDPGIMAVAGVGGALAAPVAAMVAGHSASHQRLAADKLWQCESNLLAGMKAMAPQERFHDYLVKTVNETTRRRLILPDPKAAAGTAPEADTVLETQVQQLRLERTGKDDTSYALRIEAKARLLRAADHSLLYEAPVNWRSGPCLFLDWTRGNSFQKVTQTAYREMAERLVDQLFVSTPEGPVLAGAGYKQPASRSGSAPQLTATNRGLRRSPAIQRVSYPVTDTGTIGIYPTEDLHGITMQTPRTKDGAAIEAVEEMNWTFDGLYNHPNPLVQAPSIAVGIPLGLWKQGVAVVSGLSERQFKQADAQLRAAMQGTHPHEQLALQVAQVLSAQTAQNVVLMRPPPPGIDSEVALAQRLGRDMPHGLPAAQFASVHPQPNTVLEIHVVHATLSGKGGINPPLALNVEVQARLRRATDGGEIYSCPVHYRSQERKFTRWAEDDARLFRQELQACYRDISTAVTAQLAARNLVRPGDAANSLVAGN